MSATFTLGQLAERLGATLRGAEGKVITGLATLQEARPEQLSFLANAQYRKFLAQTQAGAVLLTAADGSILNDLNAMSQVRYLFSGNPKCASMLYNDFNLPASPFITIVE